MPRKYRQIIHIIFIIRHGKLQLKHHYPFHIWHGNNSEINIYINIKRYKMQYKGR